ncbi:hypothetical protein [Halomicrococcus gelatinilyticus]|uniref:hypothetical protein n=1 Tax=Halomicrococcus gelatinilyticus TaxID=1702103 RepID=UPI002E163500
MMSESPLSQTSDDRLAELLFAGEEVEEEIPVGGARIVVTSHRVLAFTPEGDERLFDHADRPNVVDARVRTAGRGQYLSWAVRSMVYGGVLVGFGTLLHNSGVLATVGGSNVPGGRAIGGVDRAIRVASDLFGVLTDVFLFLGVALLVLAAAFAVRYYASQSEELVIERLGRDAICIPADAERAETAARQIRGIVGTSSNRRND